MLLKSFAVAAASLAATSAFLLPPEVSEADITIADTISTLSESAPGYAREQSINLDCPGCPIQFKNRHGHVKVKTGKPSHLELNFAIESETASSGERLLLNGFELYPNSDPFHNVLTAPQVWEMKEEKEAVTDDQTVQLKSHHKMRPHFKEVVPPQLGFSLQIHPAAEDKDGQQYKVVALDLQIIEVGNRFVDGIPNVGVKVIKDASGNLAIASIETTASQTPQAAPTDKLEDCTTLMCKWLAIIKDKMSHMKKKPCHGKKPAATGQAVGDEEVKQMPGHWKYRPHYMQHHGHRHSWAQLFKNITAHILLPILIGVVAGVSVSLIGMLVGTTIVFLWRTFFRRPHTHRRGHAHKAAHAEAIVAEEKSGLITHQDPPPSYEEEVEAAKKVDE